MPVSNDITTFDFIPTWDISTVIPKISLENNSIGPNLAGCSFWFEITSGGGILFHQGTESVPDASGVWANINITEPIPQVLGHIEWSGSLFKIKGYVKDSNDVINELEKTIRICRPNDNKAGQANNFGSAAVYLETRCESARLYVEDKTDYTYNGNAGTIVSKTIKLIYPPDSTGTPPAPVVVNNANNVLVPISFSADGYIVVVDAIYLYSFTDGSQVKIKYKYQKSFPIQCNIDLCPLICDIERMEKNYEKNGCSAEEREKMILINSKLNRAIMAKQQPGCGVDVSAIVDEIKKLGDFECNCAGNEFNGINPVIANNGAGLDCDGVIDCLNTTLNQLVPNCLSDDWAMLTLIEKFQLITAGSCGSCDQPGNLLPSLLTDTSISFNWLAPVNPAPDDQYQWVLYLTADDSIVQSGVITNLSVIINGLTADTEYRFEMRRVCSGSQLSAARTYTFTTNPTP